jgi:hypothetical protein
MMKIGCARTRCNEMAMVLPRGRNLYAGARRGEPRCGVFTAAVFHGSGKSGTRGPEPHTGPGGPVFCRLPSSMLQGPSLPVKNIHSDHQ